MTDDERLAAYLDDPDAVADAPASFRAVRSRLSAPSVWAEPPGDLAGRIVDDIARETLSRPGDLPHAPAARRRGPRPVWWAAVSAAAAAVIALVIVWPSGGDPPVELQLEGTPLAASASASAEVRSTPAGEAIRLDVDGLPPAPDGFFYQGWVRGDAGLVSVGTFHLRGGDTAVGLWSGVPIEEYPTLSVTLEPEDGDETSSGEVVLRGTLGGERQDR